MGACMSEQNLKSSVKSTTQVTKAATISMKGERFKEHQTINDSHSSQQNGHYQNGSTQNNLSNGDNQINDTKNHNKPLAPIQQNGQIQSPTKKRAAQSNSKCKKHKKVRASIHNHHTLHRRKNFLEPWSCSAQFGDGAGCKSENPNFLPGMGIKKWICKECPYFLCKECVKFYTEKYHNESSSSDSD
ncbi:UNKNOWN [Stylonychia lemnae]|uniref:Uncharacterized protein n=1 Tax=Stylonychia lemnae TaxID=5949 RepID=A0A078AAX3_STYLE|nr:UNKNOWN [Stylonychia lemnae]|eukprot:CDW79006.1 UNKNOWN [Stylonychia lemnae]